MTEIPEDVSFIVNLMSAMHTDTTSTIDSLWRGAVRQERLYHATIDLMREKVADLLTGPHMPMPHAIESAMYPSESEILRRVVDMYGNDWHEPTESLKYEYRF